MTFDLSHYLSLAEDEEALTDAVSIVFTGGQMSDVAQSIIQDAVGQIPATDRAGRVNLALYLTLVAPSYAVIGGET